MDEGQKTAGTFAGSVAHPQVGGRGSMEYPAQCVQLTTRLSPCRVLPRIPW